MYIDKHTVLYTCVKGCKSTRNHSHIYMKAYINANLVAYLLIKLHMKVICEDTSKLFEMV